MKRQVKDRTEKATGQGAGQGGVGWQTDEQRE